ncbi:MAG: ribosome silencing factor [Clostridia bacterium]|nr:ribosome silencing factor [Clostridia bacterium]MBO7399317.1 ribosome silencing factor [Clostridia bacterium]MBO7503863.1 ribosome silencing factor [Clostridia bacterium]MBO7658501.1 ribosome silencing factor [Clostridia bacterium]MBP5766417.1 ribosome silencing factor [Clostridia bacterium]
MTPELMVEKIKDAIDNRKGRDIEVIPLAEKTIIADYFVICSGTSTTHLRGIADEVIEKLEKEGVVAAHVEGYETATWILIDFLDVVVHIFQQSEREFYNLEKLWNGSAAGRKKAETAASSAPAEKQELG